MKNARRYAICFLVIGVLLFLGLVFRQFLVVNLIMPIATVVWLLLRIFVLSIDQLLIWALLIIAIVLLTLLRLLGESARVRDTQLPETNPALNRASYWQDSILVNLRYTGESNTTKRNLISLLTTIKSSRLQGAGELETRQALRLRQIDLPDPVYAFLFADETPAPKQSFFEHPAEASKKMLQFWQMAPERWMHRWMGRDTAEYYLAIDQVLTVMESSLEMKHDYRSVDTPTVKPIVNRNH